MREYKIISDNGHIVYVTAKSRKEAIEVYINELGCDRTFVKDHCVVKCLGFVCAWERKED